MAKKVQKQVEEKKSPRSITLIEGKPPQINGEWRVGEILSMANSLSQWIQSLPMGTPPEAEIETLVEDEND